MTEARPIPVEGLHPTSRRLLVAGLASVLMCGAWLGYVAWVWAHRQKSHPVYSDWLGATLRELAATFAGWFVLSPETRRSLPRRLLAAAGAGVVAFVAVTVWIMSIIFIQSVQVEGFAPGASHSLDVFCRAFRSSGWLHMVALSAAAMMIAVVARFDRASRALPASRS